mmetsp:Transcript_11959/g.24781  ORF Transcript_11959/g.24781 Transcript_11959/m.24781 type:complete len:194 (+) Transcript_11959:146-727(+)
MDDTVDVQIPVEAESKPPQRQSPKRGHEVWLHIYDIDPVTARLNEAVLRALNLGAFHCGLEVLGREWFFACGDSEGSGVLRNEPRRHPAHLYKESLCMGETPLSKAEIQGILVAAADAWPASSYHVIKRNCITFAEQLARALHVSEPFPAWVRGAVDAGSSPLLFPVADCGWRWVKWWRQVTPMHRCGVTLQN